MTIVVDRKQSVSAVSPALFKPGGDPHRAIRLLTLRSKDLRILVSPLPSAIADRRSMITVSL